VEVLTNLGLAARLGLLISAAPLGMGLAFALWPSERKLALMRPLSTAGTFAAISTLLLQLANALIGLSRAATVDVSFLQRAAIGLAESMLAVFLAFACLTAGWLFVALGMRKQA
jgi:hypothetical protein